MVTAKNWNNKRHILRNLASIFVFILFINAIQNWLLIRWENNEAKIHLSLDSVIMGIKDAGYSIDNYGYIHDEYQGYLGFIKQGLWFGVITENGVHGVTLIKEDNWMDARRGVEISYEREQQGVFGYSYACGDILIHVMNKKLGNMLFKTIAQMDNGQGKVIGCIRNPPSIYPLFYFGL
jgi:hypothetical protein